MKVAPLIYNIPTNTIGRKAINLPIDVRIFSNYDILTNQGHVDGNNEPNHLATFLFRICEDIAIVSILYFVVG